MKRCKKKRNAEEIQYVLQHCAFFAGLTFILVTYNRVCRQKFYPTILVNISSGESYFLWITVTKIWSPAAMMKLSYNTNQIPCALNDLIQTNLTSIALVTLINLNLWGVKLSFYFYLFVAKFYCELVRLADELNRWAKQFESLSLNNRNVEKNSKKRPNDEPSRKNLRKDDSNFRKQTLPKLSDVVSSEQTVQKWLYDFDSFDVSSRRSVLHKSFFTFRSFMKVYRL